MTPSGSFPSPGSRPDGSRATGVSASLKALAKIPLMAECLSGALRFYGRTGHGSHQWKPASHRHADALKPIKHPDATPPQGGVFHF